MILLALETVRAGKRVNHSAPCQPKKRYQPSSRSMRRSRAARRSDSIALSICRSIVSPANCAGLSSSPRCRHASAAQVASRVNIARVSSGVSAVTLMAARVKVAIMLNEKSALNGRQTDELTKLGFSNRFLI